jgi:hypothetical protein
MSCFIYLSRVSIISLYAQNCNILYYKNIRGNKEFTFIPGLKSGVFPFMFDKACDLTLGGIEGGDQRVDLALAGGGEGNLRALCQKALDDGSADSAGTAGNQYNFIL